MNNKPVAIDATKEDEMLSRQELQEIYKRLAEPFPPEAVERSSSADTRRGYDTTGIKYQFIVNRLNEVLGVGGFRVERTFNVREKQARSGAVLFDVTCDLVMQLGHWTDGSFMAFAEASGTGGHTAASEADAKKGAFTNGFKKVAAFFGAGWQAYAGVIDDDNKPADFSDDTRRSQRAPGTSRSGEAGHDGAKEQQGPKDPYSSGIPKSAGRVSQAQLRKLRDLVDETGGEWGAFRDQVRAQHGVNVEFGDTKLASSLITELVAIARKRRANGDDPNRRTR